MNNILHITSSPRGQQSFSIKLGNAIVDKLQAANSGSKVTTTDLVAMSFPHLEEAHLTSFYTPKEQHSDANKEAIRHSDEAIAQLMNADTIVIGAPMYNFNIHSTLKAWIDHVVRSGITFSYDANGPKGLLTSKKVYLAIASGGIFSEGPMQANDYIAPYLTFMLGFIGLTDVTVFRVEGTVIPGIQDTAMQKALDSIVL